MLLFKFFGTNSTFFPISFGRKVREIGVFFLLFLSLPSYAQVDHEHSSCDDNSISPMKEAILSEITVQGVTGIQRLRDAASPFAVISPKELHRIPAPNIVDLISHQPGLSQISSGAGISKPVIRGLGYNRVVVVEQGIRQEGQQWGDEHGLEVDAEGVHSVEILKGPASLMYGSDAIAGVMILHPEKPLMDETMQAKVSAGYQSNNGLYNYTASFAGNVNRFVWNWHFSDKAAHCYKNSLDGYVPGSWFRERDVLGMFGINRSWGHSWLRFSNVNFTPGISEGERDEETGELVWEDDNSAHSYSRQTPFQRVVHTKVVSDNAWYMGDGTLKAIFGYQQNYRREFENSFVDPELSLRLHTVNYDVRYQHDFPSDWHFAAGVGGMWQQNINAGEEYLIPDFRLFDIGAFMTTRKQINRWHLSGGLRFDNRSLSTDSLFEEDEIRFKRFTPHFSGLTGSLGAVYNLNSRANLRLNVARGFRSPTVNELSSNGVHEGSIQYELGNASLKSEYSFQTDLGFDYTTHFVSLQASLFLNRIDNYIFLSRLANVLTEGYATYQYRQGDARLMGGEMSLDVHPFEALHVENSFSYVHAIQLNQPAESHYLPMIPAPRWNCRLRYSFPDFLHKRCRRSYVSAGMEYNFRQDHFYALDGTETATPAYCLFDLSAGVDVHVFRENCLMLTLSCQNLFDKVYQPHLSRLKYTDVNLLTGRQGVSTMGRNVCLKVTIPIDIHLH